MKKSLAIVFSSICFSAFHFSFSQGIGNISLLFSLFVFALFLGFIYERQGSLFASISLHMTLNIVSVARILLSPIE
jgi:membrane protease YdiL (CAAX protease family)